MADNRLIGNTPNNPKVMSKAALHGMPRTPAKVSSPGGRANVAQFSVDNGWNAARTGGLRRAVMPNETTIQRHQRIDKVLYPTRSK